MKSLNNLKIKISENFSRAAEIYDKEAGLQDNIAGDLVRLANPYLLAGSKILDLGSGTGFIAKNLGRKIIQLDMALGMCKKSSKISPTICAYIENLPFKNEQFDAIFSSSSIQWLSSLDNAFSEISRILSDHGYFFFTSFGTETLKELRNSYSSLNLEAKLHKFHSKEEVEKSLHKAGFKIVDYKSEEKIFEYDSVRSLMRSIKNIGAGATLSADLSENSMLTRKKLGLIESHYKNNYFRKNSLYSTWEVLYFVCQRSL